MNLQSQFSKDTLTHTASRYPRMDIGLLEKVLRAIQLLESLAMTEVPFIFKGGTAAMLLSPVPHRFSIDIDILLDAPSRVIFRISSHPKSLPRSPVRFSNSAEKTLLSNAQTPHPQAGFFRSRITKNCWMTSTTWSLLLSGNLRKRFLRPNWSENPSVTPTVRTVTKS